MNVVTVSLSEFEMNVLGELCMAQDISHPALLRQALRTYQYLYLERAKGNTLAFLDEDGNVIKEEVFGLDAFE